MIATLNGRPSAVLLDKTAKESLGFFMGTVGLAYFPKTFDSAREKERRRSNSSQESSERGSLPSDPFLFIEPVVLGLL